VEINDTNATLKMRKTNKLKVVNVQRIKPFFEETLSYRPLAEDIDLSPNDSYQDARPMTRARAKLIKLQQRIADAVDLISEMEDADESDDADAEISISAISEDLREYLTAIARKLLISEEDNFHELTPEEQQLWTAFPTSEIYEFITGLPDEIPEFRYDWITTSGAVFTPAPAAAAAAPPPAPGPQPEDGQPPPPDLPIPAPPPPPPQAKKQTTLTRLLRQRKKIDYKDLHEGTSVFKFAAQRASKRWGKVTKSVPFFGSPPSASKQAST